MNTEATILNGNHRCLADITVLIPAAGGVPEGIVGLGNIGCPAMIPIAGRPVIYWAMKYLRSLGLRRFVIGVSRRGMFVEDFVECMFGSDCEVEFIVPAVSRGVGPHGAGVGLNKSGNCRLARGVGRDTLLSVRRSSSDPQPRRSGGAGSASPRTTIPIAGARWKRMRRAQSQCFTTKRLGCQGRWRP